jgi:predicted Zn-dependent peptidase
VAYEHAPGALTGIALAVRCGSRFDGRYPGIAHLAEHMLFQGTVRRSHEDVNRRAAELGGDHDANTGYEDLHLTFQVLNGDVPEAIALLAEQAMTSTVPEERLETERQVVAQEIRGHREDAITYLCDETWSRFFAGGLSYPPSGTLASISRISAARLRRFLRERFVASNMVLSIVGGASRSEVRRAVAREFRALPDGRELRASGARIARSGEARFRRSGLSQLYVTTIVSVPHEPRPLVALGMALEILGTDPDGRLYREVRERHGLSYDLWADLQVGAGWATMQVGAVAPRRSERQLRQAIERVFVEAAERGFGEEEVTRARRKVKYRYARLSEQKLERAASHAASVLYGALGLAEAERLVRSISRPEIEGAWRAALAGPRLTGVLTG